MKKKILTTTLLSMSLLSLNLSAGTGMKKGMKCANGVCIVDLSNIAPKAKKQDIKKSISSKESYKTIILDNIETIIFSDYVMRGNELIEHQLNDLSNILEDLNEENLPLSKHFCEDNLKPMVVENMLNTYVCA